MPARAVRNYFGVEITTGIADWRKAGNARVPFSLRQANGEDSDEPATVATGSSPVTGGGGSTEGALTGEVITAVDDKPASAMRLAELRKVLTTEDSSHVLEVRRGEETLRLNAVVKLVSLDD